MDMNQYLDMFIDESKEHIQAINEQLLELEKNPANLAIVNEIFRSAHTLKGMSATMGYEDLAQLTHQMENVLDAIRNEKLEVSATILDVVFQSIDELEAMVGDISTGGDGKRNVQGIVSQLKQIEQGVLAEDEVAATLVAERPATKSITYDEYDYEVIAQSMEQKFSPLELTITLDDNCLLKGVRVYMVFEMLEQLGEVIKSVPTTDILETEDFGSTFHVTLISKEAGEDIKNRILKISEIREVCVELVDVQQLRNRTNNEPAITEKVGVAPIQTSNDSPVEVEEDKKSKKGQVASKTIRVNIERLDILMNLFEELVIDRGRLEQISKELNDPGLIETVERMARVSGDLQGIILNMRMVPIEMVFNRFPRMIRQLARDLGKEINLTILGADTEIDRTVIDEIGDPLVHLIRNAIDHGVEMPDIRRANNKLSAGNVTLNAFHSGNHVFIEIKDDGAGISREKVLRKAISKGLVTEQEGKSLTDKQVYNFILASGFSTAEKLSDISGRGVGLDVVKNTIESLGGIISIDSREGEGSTFSIQLPLTLSIISALLVEVKAEKYAIPLSSIIETAIIQKEDILSIHNQQVIDFRGNIVPLVFINDIFEVASNGIEETSYCVVLVKKGDKTAGLVVNSFIGQQEIVLKSLGSYLDEVFAISGATILGDGQVALIIDCNALIG